LVELAITWAGWLSGKFENHPARNAQGCWSKWSVRIANQNQGSLAAEWNSAEEEEAFRDRYLPD
jgi:hypothetical protein